MSEKRTEWIPLTLDEAYAEIDRKALSVKTLIDEIKSLIEENPPEIFHDIHGQQALHLVLRDSLLSVDAFYIEIALRDLDDKRDNGIKIDEDKWMLGRAALMAADDTKVALRESGYIVESTFETIDKEDASNSLKVIKDEYQKEFQKFEGYRK